MLGIFEIRPEPKAPKVLLVDDEDHFRGAMKKELIARGYNAFEVKASVEAIDAIGQCLPEVVIIDRNMPELSGIRTANEIKKKHPATQIIMLSAYGSKDEPAGAPNNDVFKCLHKPCGISELIDSIEAALQERMEAVAFDETLKKKKKSFIRKLTGVHNSRPGLLIMGAVLFLLIALMPPSDRLNRLLTAYKIPAGADLIAGYAYYPEMKAGESISGYYHRQAEFIRLERVKPSKTINPSMQDAETLFRAKVMVGVLTVAGLYWATGAMPVGICALLVVGLMYFFSILAPDQLAHACMTDAVIFLFGVLVMSKVITKTGIDRRMGGFLLGISTRLWKVSFLFIPLLALAASFFSKNILVPCIVPVLMMAYAGVARASDSEKDRYLAVMMILMVCYAVNLGGPGSPASGGRNALMLSILSDYGRAPDFGQWMTYGLPFVPACALVMGAYFYFMIRRKLKSQSLIWDGAIRKEAKNGHKMTRDEYVTIAVLILLLLLWIFTGDRFGLGGPVVLSIAILNICGVIQWRDINKIHWDVIALYASACAMGTGLAVTGAALWLADGFMELLPAVFKSGPGLAISASAVTGVMTNFMSDGATVAVLGPVMVQAAGISGTHPWMVGFAVAFASSFSHMLVIATPSNAIAYSMARDPDTGRPMLTMRDFFIHGAAVLLVSFLMLWFWTILGYWQWIGFPNN